MPRTRNALIFAVFASLLTTMGLVAGCSDKVISDSRQVKASLGRSVSLAPQTIRQWRVGDTWEYEFQEVEPTQLTARVTSATPRPDIGGQALTCLFTEHTPGQVWYRRSKYLGQPRRIETKERTKERQYFFVQYPDGSLTCSGGTDSDNGVYFAWIAGAYLPALRSPLSTGQELNLPNSSYADARSAKPYSCDFFYKITGAEAISFEGKTAPAYRIDIRNVQRWEKDDEQKQSVEEWTEWYTGEQGLVQRTQRDSFKSFGVPLSRSVTMKLVKFTRGQ